MKKFAFIVVALTLSTAVLGDQPKVYPRDSVVANRTLADWSAAWRQWADSMPADNHPLFDTASSCSEGNSGPVWFLGGKFCAFPTPPGQVCDNSHAVRTCNVPRGVSLYFPVVNTSCLDGEAIAGQCITPGGFSAGPNITQIRQVAAEMIDHTENLEVSIDGKLLEGNLKNNFRVQSTVYTTLLPDNNLYQASGETNIVKGQYIGVDDGVYVMLKPLPKGRHTLNFKGRFTLFDFNLDVTYNLFVQ